MRPVFQALFLDIPSLIDSSWRHIEHKFNAEFVYRPGVSPKIAPRPLLKKPPFWFFAITALFVSYGPTWDGLCTTFPPHVADFLRQGLGLLIIFGSLALALFLGREARELIDRRFENVARELAKQERVLSPARRDTSAIVLCAALIVGMMAGVCAGAYLYAPPDRICGTEGRSVVAGWRLAMCIAAIAAFAAVTRIQPTSVKHRVVAQAVILAVVAAVQWLLLTSPRTPEALDLPYRHVFLVWAPCIVAVAALAPWIAWRAFRSSSGVPNATRERLRDLLAQTELFVNRPEDLEPSWRRIGYAIVYGPGYHPLHLMLLPALVALVVPVKWLYWSVFVAFIVSALLLVWGNVSSRWQQSITYIERWFLRGTPLFVSLFVIIVAVLRLVKFDYVSTILDTIPFGMIFGLVVMSYVLFWLVEYWISRAAASQLLDVLGTAEDEVRVPYPRALPLDPAIRVQHDGRILASHGTGRFVVMGTTHDRQQRPVTAFQSYYLMELFSRLGDHTGNPQDHDHVSDINRRTGMYFFSLNALLFLVTAGFAGFFVYEHYWANNRLDPVVSARAAPPADGLVDLASRLQTDLARPAIVVVGSGGGTRAALYTASVLNGLHRLGVDRDIELVSGVSGGGVALAYFAANNARLTAASSGGAQGTECPADRKAPRTVAEEWKCFTRAVTKPFIEDVLNGASEWRVFRTTALTELLAESFERHLFPAKPSLGSLSRPALILNSAIVAHPADESEALAKTIEQDMSCEESERPFKLLGGGRLVFTNLRDTQGFPSQKPPIPDIRLPYQIVRDPTVPLARAAALNANFPPVFPNARVQIRNDGQGNCKAPSSGQPYELRSYYVTDGGAEENLGLISALYALESALDSARAKSPQPVRVRPIHVVIAEASAVSYDYAQDHGLSAGLSGSRERLAGGLTNALLERVDAKLKSLHSENAAVRYHYLGLPLAFRARGGFGTHWLYAREFHLNDPRPRTSFWLNLRPTSAFSDQKAAITQRDLEQLWLALHDPDPNQPFCANQFKDDPEKEKVRRWICGLGSAGGLDLHVDKWSELLKALRPTP